VPDFAVAGYTLGELAVRFGCQLRGDPARRISSVATLAGGSRSVGFLVNPALLVELRGTRLGAVILAPTRVGDCPDGTAALIHANPHAVFARIAAALHAEPAVSPGIHPTALVHAGAQVAASAEVGPFAVVEARAVVGARCRVGAHAVLGEGATLGADSRLAARSTVLAGCSLGARCVVHAGAVIGSDGFGNARDGVEWVKVPQLGAVRIGDDVSIGANTTVDRGALDDTVIGDGVRIDNLVQVAHNVTIGAHTAIAACVAIAGSTHIGQRCMIGGGAGFSGQLTVGDDIVIGGFAQVTHSIAAPGFYSSAMPVEEMGVWRRLLGRFKRLDALNARVRRLEAAVNPKAVTGQKDDDN
jgi:UDP-3-O-[3-hydroxymyristoyl] glucosamine N-acyltransferase